MAESRAAPAVLSRKRGRSLMEQDPVLYAAFTHVAQYCSKQGFHAVSTSLTQHGIIPTESQLQLSVPKSLNERPPWIHWNKSDMAPQLRCTDAARCGLQASVLRGYRMARASHAASPGGGYFFEVQKLPGPLAREIAQSLPPQARLGPALKEELKAALEWEEKHSKMTAVAMTGGDGAATGPSVASIAPETDVGKTESKEPEIDDKEDERPKVGGNFRVGWSMRTGDLQGPVGYDKWSYSIRDRGGSITHKSQRQDDWGGDGFEVGDFVGCAILLNEDEDNHIRFFKNGTCLGPFVLAKGKRLGGEAFVDLEDGVYYPAVSLYMGGAVRANFGPNFVHPPRKLPAGVARKISPLSNVCPTPVTPEVAVADVSAILKSLTVLTPEQITALKLAVQTEAAMVYEAHQTFCKQQLEFVRKEREERGISTQDLQVDTTDN